MKESITIRLEKELLEFLKEEAEKDFRSVNNYIEMVLMKHRLENEKTENPAK